jgi:hypothetical protein
MKNKKVLIVDDNALNRKVFENVIGHNYFFESASDGLEAIDLLKKNKYDIILMDIQMPKLDGISCLKIIKDEEITDIPVIAISAYSNQGDREYFLSTGFDDFIAKPVKPKNLLEAIHFHLHQDTSRINISDKHKHIDEDINESVIQQLLKYHNLENIRSVYKDFLDEAENLIEEIKLLSDFNKFEEIGEKLHILKGNSGTLGINIVYKATSSFENKIKNRTKETFDDDIALLKSSILKYKKLVETDKIFTKHE